MAYGLEKFLLDKREEVKALILNSDLIYPQIATEAGMSISFVMGLVQELGIHRKRGRRKRVLESAKEV